VTKDGAKAVTLYTRACNQVTALLRGRQIARQGGLRGQHAGPSNALFEAKCDAGDLVAYGMLGEDLLRGTGTSVNRAKGTALLKKACAGGWV
jgi:TPR repeat protein